MKKINVALLTLFMALVLLTSCEENDSPDVQQEPIFSEVTYEWNSDYTSCTATKTCINDSKLSITETVASTKNVNEATCIEVGSIAYQADFVNEEFKTQNYVVALETIDHNFDYSNWSLIEVDGHAHECTYCKKTTNIEEHKFYGNSLIKCTRICVKCGFVHFYSDEIKTITENIEYKYNDDGNIICWDYKWIDKEDNIYLSKNEYEYSEDLCVKFVSKIYDLSNNYISKHVTAFEYNEANICIKDTYEKYDKNDQLISKKVYKNNRLSYMFDRVLIESKYSNYSTEFDELGNIIKSSTITYDLSGNLLESRNSESEYKNNKLIKSVNNVYDGENNLIENSITEYGDSITKTSIYYNKQGFITSKKITVDEVIVYQLISENNSEDNIVGYNEYVFEYINTLCVLEKRIDYDVDFNIKLSITKEREYDDSGLCIKETSDQFDEFGVKYHTITKYNGYGIMIEDESTRYYFDNIADYNLTKYNANEKCIYNITIKYDSNGSIEEKKETINQYDESNLLLQSKITKYDSIYSISSDETDIWGIEVADYEYNELGKVIKITSNNYDEFNEYLYKNLIEYEYDGEEISRELYTSYDANDNLIRETIIENEIEVYEMWANYENNIIHNKTIEEKGNLVYKLTVREDIDGSILWFNVDEYEYDENNNCIKKSIITYYLDWSIKYKIENIYGYDDNGQLISSSNFHYDSNGNLTYKCIMENDIEIYKMSSDYLENKLVSQWIYEYGNLIYEYGNDWILNGHSGDCFYEYEYDENNNCVKIESSVYDGDNILYLENIDYDEAGNIISKTTYDYEYNNEVLIRCIHTIYDSQGNVISQTIESIN